MIASYTLSSTGILFDTCVTVLGNGLADFVLIMKQKIAFLRYISKCLGVLGSIQESDTPYVAVIAVLVVVIVVLVAVLAVGVVVLRYMPIIESLNPYFTCFYINYLLISSQ